MRAYITLFIFFIIAIASYWLLNDITEESSAKQQASEHFPDYFLDNFSIVSMNSQGQPEYTLSAKKMLHFSDDDSAELEQPFLNISQEKGSVTLKASHGKLLKQEDIIHLYDNIIIHRNATEKQGELYIYTDYLKINTQSQIIETHLAARIKTDGAEINTTGLIFNNRQGTLKLHSNVKGVYEASQ